MRFLLDTNVLSEVAKPRPDPTVLNWLIQHEAASAVPSIAIAERHEGAHNAPPAKRPSLLAELDALVENDQGTILPFDAKAAAAWGEYVSRPALKLRRYGAADTMIAAIAIANDLIVVTRDTEDFPEVPTLNPFSSGLTRLQIRRKWRL
jgi:predicted nucleic acid-binding protein